MNAQITWRQEAFVEPEESWWIRFELVWAEMESERAKLYCNDRLTQKEIQNLKKKNIFCTLMSQ